MPTALTRNSRAGRKGNTELKAWTILTQLRRCPWRAGQIAKTILVCKLTKSKQDEKTQ